jgi:putative MATE family efflux protein
VAQAFGEGDPHRMRKYFANALYLCGGLAAVMSVVTALAARPILRWIGTPEDIMDQAYGYIVYIFGGMLAVMLYNLSSSVLRAVGNTRTPLYFLVLSCAVNVGLDILFVVGLGMGVTGAALATVAAQLLSGLLCIRVIFSKYDVLRIRGEEWKPDGSCLSRLSGIGLPMGLQFSITAIGSLIMQTAVNSLGTVAVAAIGAGAKVYTMFVCPFDAMGATIATWCGQNLGARRIDRVRQGVRISVLSMTVYAFVALFAVRLLGRPMIGLFITGGETAVIDKAVQYLNMVVMFFIPLLLIFVLRNALQGLGYSRVAMLAGLFELVGRAFVAFALVGPYGFDGAILANPAAWIMADALLIPVYLHTVRALQQCRAGVPGRVAG